MNRKPNTPSATAPMRDRAEAELREMGTRQSLQPMMAELHRRALAQLRKQRKNQRPEVRLPKSEDDPRRLLHELQVHQVELELQNDELREARERTEALLEKYTDLYDFAPVGYFTLAVDGAIQQVNLNGASLVGIERSRLVGQPFRLLVSAELRPAFQAFLKQAIADPAKQSGDFDLSRPGRPPRAVNLEAQRSPDGKECRVVAMDITVRKRAEEVLQEREARLRAFLKNSAVIGWLKDEDGRHVFLSENYERRFGVRLADWRGKTDFEVWPQEIAEEFRRNDQTVLTSGNPLEVMESAIDKAGQKSWWLSNKFTFRDAAGRRYVGGLGVDITARKQAEMNFQLLASISHDLARLKNLDEMMPVISAKIAAHLNLSLVCFVEINEAADQAVCTHDWHRDDVPGVRGTYRLADYVTADFQKTCRAGKLFVVRDTANDPRLNAKKHAAVKVGAVVSVPLVRDGQWRFLISFHHSEAHDWPADEITLMHELATRIWTRWERLRAEDKVRVSEVRYRRLFEAAHDGVLLLDPDTRQITDANPFMTKLLGYPRDQLVGKELFEIGLLKDEAASREVFRKLKRKHQVRYEDLPLESKTGRHQEVEVVANLYQENGHEVIQCNIRDITERKQAEIVSNRLAAIVAFSQDAIISNDPTGIITSWNRGAEKIFGYAAHEMVGTSILRLIPADRQDEEQYILGKIKRGDSVRHFDTLRQTKNGRLINVSITASPIKDATGRVIGVSKVARDITERKQTEEMLRRNEALFSALVAQAPVGVYVVDARMRLQQVNPLARRVFQKIRPLIGRDFSEVIHAVWPRRTADHVLKLFRRTLDTGAPYRSLDFAERRRDIGVKEFYEWQIERVTLPAGEQGVVCFFQDVTERKRAEAAQRRSEVLAASNRKLEQEIVRRRAVETALKQSERHQRRLLEQSHRLQEQLRHLSRQILRAQEEERKRISRELHDVIAQTLTGINLRLAALKKEAAHNTKGLDRNIADTQRLVQKSVDIVHRFARELRPAVLDDLGLIPALHSFMKNFISQTGIRSRLTAFAAVEQLDGAARTVLYRVAQEALTNVAKHAQASRVEVNIQKLADCVCMKIKDDGKSFQVKQALHSRGRKHLGLLGMRERLEMVGGRFEVESVPGQGTTVRAEIPFPNGGVRGGGRKVH